MSKFIFYDIPSKDNQGSWSPNTWKTRLALNFKGVDYETEWIEYPDIAAALSPRVEQNVIKAKSDTPYSLPAVKFPDGTYVMESRKIATRLEQDYPSPSFKLDNPILAEVARLVPKMVEPLRGVWMPNVPGNLLNPHSSEYFAQTRSKRYGKSLEDFGKEHGGEEAWMEALPATKELGTVLQRNGGPFVLGKEACYADLTILAFLQFLVVVDKQIYEKLVGIEPTLRTLYEASQQWTERSRE